LKDAEKKKRASIVRLGGREDRTEVRTGADEKDLKERKETVACMNDNFLEMTPYEKGTFRLTSRISYAVASKTGKG